MTFLQFISLLAMTYFSPYNNMEHRVQSFVNVVTHARHLMETNTERDMQYCNIPGTNWYFAIYDTLDPAEFQLNPDQRDVEQLQQRYGGCRTTN